jgi:hypothetical protein
MNSKQRTLYLKALKDNGLKKDEFVEQPRAEPNNPARHMDRTVNVTSTSSDDQKDSKNDSHLSEDGNIWKTINSKKRVANVIKRKSKPKKDIPNLATTTTDTKRPLPELVLTSGEYTEESIGNNKKDKNEDKIMDFKIPKKKKPVNKVSPLYDILVKKRAPGYDVPIIKAAKLRKIDMPGTTSQEKEVEKVQIVSNHYYLYNKTSKIYELYMNIFDEEKFNLRDLPYQIELYP